MRKVGVGVVTPTPEYFDKACQFLNPSNQRRFNLTWPGARRCRRADTPPDGSAPRGVRRRPGRQ
eukprot:758592-Hanusia_phi.AAC.1